MLMNLHFDPEAQKKSAEDQTRKSTDAPSGSEGVAKADQESKLGLSFPPTFKFDLGPMKMKTGLTIDDFDLYEANEAFLSAAASTLRTKKKSQVRN